MTQNSPVNFKLVQFLLWVKGSHQTSNFWTFKRALVKIYYNSSSLLKTQVSFLSNVLSVCSTIKHNSSILFLAQTVYTLVKSNLLKCKFLKFSSARVKICQMSHVNYELTSQFLFKFSIIRHCHDTNPPLSILSSCIFYFE